MKYSKYDVVLLKDGREGAVLELFKEDESALVDFGDSEEVVLCSNIVKTTYKHQKNT